MEILYWLETIGIVILLVLIVFIIPYWLIRKVKRYITKKSGNTIANIATGIILGLFLLFIYSIIIRFGGCGVNNIQYSISHEEEIELLGLEGKLVYNIPDTLYIYKPHKINVRISNKNISDRIILRQIDKYADITEEVIPLSSIMKVDITESNSENKLKIKRLNNSEEQFIDTNTYTEWLFEVTPIDYGKVELTISVSQIRYMQKYGRGYYDIPVYVKTISIYASQSQKIQKIWNDYYWIVLITISLFLIVISMYLPKKTKISINMSDEKKTNYWNAGSLGLAIYIITIMSIAFFKLLNISLYYVPLVFVGTVLIYTVFTAVTLRDNEKISEDNFIKLMGIALKKIPPLSFFYKKDEKNK